MPATLSKPPTTGSAHRGSTSSRQSAPPTSGASKVTQAWHQARRPGAFAGSGIRSGVTELDAAYSASVLACWHPLQQQDPQLANVAFTSPNAPQFVREANAELVFYWDGDNRFKPRTTVTILVKRIRC